MRLYSQIKKDERHIIKKMHYTGISKNDLNIYLGRNRPTIYREYTKNRTRGYNYREAHDQAQTRRNVQKRKLDTNGISGLLSVCY